MASRNTSLAQINKNLLKCIAERLHIYKSIDTDADLQEVVCYPIELLNVLNPSGLTPHALRLKIGDPVMMLRNQESPRLCNESHLVVRKLLPRVIAAAFLT